MKLFDHPSFHRWALALVFALCGWIQFYTLPCPDIAWLLFGARRWLEGAALYRDIIEPNPPLIFWLYAIPSALAKTIGGGEAFTLKYCVIMLAGLSLWLCAQSLKHSLHWRNNPARKSLILGMAALLLLGADSYIVFAQREYLLVVLFLPFAFLHLPSVAPKQTQRLLPALAGLMAAIGLCLKPHFFLLWGVSMAHRSWRTRSLKNLLSIADSAIILFTLAYISTVLHFAPEYQSWLGILTQTYMRYRHIGETRFDIMLWFAFIALVAMALAHLLRVRAIVKRDPCGDDIAYLLWLTAAAYLQALVQFKTWQYIAYPFAALGMVTVIYLIAIRGLNNFLSFALLAWVFFPFTPLSDNRQDGNREAYRLIMDEMKPVAGEVKNIYIASPIFAPALFYMHRDDYVWSSRFPMLQFLLQGIVQSSDTGELSTQTQPGMEKTQHWLLTAMGDDIVRTQPQALLIYRIEKKQPSPDPAFDLYRWMQQDAVLELMLRRYEKAHEIKVCHNAREKCFYDLYLRIP